MRRALMLGGVSVALVLTSAVRPLQKQQGTRVIFARSSTAKYAAVIPGVTGSDIWGDTLKGPYGRFVRFKPGFDAGVHTHTSDGLLVVLRGAYLYRDDDGEKRVGPGDFIWIPGGHKHWSGGDAKEGALFYNQWFGKFDLIPAK